MSEGIPPLPEQPLSPTEFLARFDEIAKAIDRGAGELIAAIDKVADAVLQVLDELKARPL